MNCALTSPFYIRPVSGCAPVCHPCGCRYGCLLAFPDFRVLAEPVLPNVPGSLVWFVGEQVEDIAFRNQAKVVDPAWMSPPVPIWVFINSRRLREFWFLECDSGCGPSDVLLQAASLSHWKSMSPWAP